MRSKELQLKILEIQNNFESRGTQYISTPTISGEGYVCIGKSFPKSLGVNDIFQELKEEYPKINIKKNIQLLSDENCLELLRYEKPRIKKITNNGYDFLDHNGNKKPNEVKITNFDELTIQFEKLNETQQNFIFELMKRMDEFNFNKLDELIILKENLEKDRENKDSNIDWNLLINFISMLSTLRISN